VITLPAEEPKSFSEQYKTGKYDGTDVIQLIYIQRGDLNEHGISNPTDQCGETCGLVGLLAYLRFL
jgi:hypothetical protein